jgi:hypothetical protein
VIAHTYDSTACYVWPFSPNWDRPVKLTLTLGAEVTDGLGGISSRRPEDLFPVLKFKFDIWIDGDDARALRLALLSYQEEPVVMPLWPFDELVADFDGSRFKAGLAMTYETDWSALEVHDIHDEPAGSFSADARRCPVMWGYLSKAIDPDALTDEDLEATVNFTEVGDGSRGLRFARATATDGPTIQGQDVPVWDFPPDFDGPAVGGAPTMVKRRTGANARQPFKSFYPQTPARVGSCEFYFTGQTEAAAMASFFEQVGGPSGMFWVPNWLTETPLSADVSAGASSLTVEDPAMLDRGRALALCDGPGRVDFARITNSGAIANPVTIAPVTSRAYRADKTVVASLILARFEQFKLEFVFFSDSHGTVRVGWLEVPLEYEAQTDETLGTTHGKLPQTARLFDFVVTEAGASTHHRFTDCPHEVVYDGENWATMPIELSRLALQTGRTSGTATIALRLPSDATSVFRRLFPYSIVGTLSLTVTEVDVTELDDFSQAFSSAFA